MKNTDLRIGNFVYGDTYNGKITVFNNNQCVIKHKGGIAKLLIEDLKPIPLSEEVLLKCGFERSEIHENFYFIKLNDWTKIYVSFHEKQYAVELSVSKHSFCPKVKYLHQLQNLFYALTGEELEVSL